jgi:hypothetical protein
MTASMSSTFSIDFLGDSPDLRGAPPSAHRRGLTYQPQGKRVWTLTEYNGRRTVFASRLTRETAAPMNPQLAVDAWASYTR